MIELWWLFLISFLSLIIGQWRFGNKRKRKEWVLGLGWMFPNWLRRSTIIKGKREACEEEGWLQFFRFPKAYTYSREERILGELNNTESKTQAQGNFWGHISKWRQTGQARKEGAPFCLFLGITSKSVAYEQVKEEIWSSLQLQMGLNIDFELIFVMLLIDIMCG